MKAKKSPRVNLESLKPIFMQIGLILTLAMVLIAFEWSSTEIRVSAFVSDGDIFIEEDFIPVTRTVTIPPPPPPKPKPADLLVIVDNLDDLDDELELVSTEYREDLSDYLTDYSYGEEEYREPSTFYIVEDMPEFPGGEIALLRYLAENVRYPTKAQETGIQGRVLVKFIVNQFGEVCEVELARGIHPVIDVEALRVVENMPNWKPGMQRGVAVRVSFTVPISFVLHR